MVKNPAAVALGRRGGKARAAALSPEVRSAIARKAGLANAKRLRLTGDAEIRALLEKFRGTGRPS